MAMELSSITDSAVEGANQVSSSSRRDGNGSRGDSDGGLGLKESTVWENGGEVCQDELRVADDGGNEVLDSVEETDETSAFFDTRSDDMEEYISRNQSDDDLGDDDSSSPLLDRTREGSSLGASSRQNRGNQEFLSRRSENEVFLGGNDWGEYMHEFEGDIALSRESWDALKQQDQASSTAVDVDGNMSNGSIERIELEDGSEEEYLLGNAVQVRGTGRPDLDDAEDDFGSVVERFSPQSLGDPFLEGRSNGSGRPDLDEEEFFLEENGNVLSFFREVPSEGDFELQEQIDEHAQDELRSEFFRKSSDPPVSLKEEEETPHETDHSKRPRFPEGNPRVRTVQFVQLPEAPSANAPLGMYIQQPSPGPEIANSVDVLSNEPLRERAETLQRDLSQDPREGEYSQADTPSEKPVEVRSRPKGSVVRLGSKLAEELLQMDPAKLGRAVYTSISTPEYIPERTSIGWDAQDLGPDEVSRYVEALEVKETYIDTVLDMEDVLFDAEEGTGALGFRVGKPASTPAVGRPSRDGSVSASTSSEPCSIRRSLSASVPTEVDSVEVVGAFQRRGGASLGDRVVGLKEHTVYRLRVNRGSNEWEIRRRYRDFVVLYSQLVQLLSHRGGKVELPVPWEKVKAESRKFFGNTSPGVVEARSALIQVCLRSLLEAGPPLSTATPLLRFLFPTGEVSRSAESLWQLAQKHNRGGDSSPALAVPLEGSTQSQVASPESCISNAEEGQNDGFSAAVFGKTIRLIVQIHKKNPLKQQLQAQHYTCAGCYKHLESAIGLVPEIVQNWGWSGPRYCEYSGQLFCSTCHLNETAVIPAWVLQRWDFAPRPVSQLAKAYLDSIFDKPMLCVSAVNPYLYARVPILAHLTEIRRTVSKVLACIRCPARPRFLAMMGSRSYLLENNDFFALRDLADLSRGAFAVLPGYMQALSVKLSRHITRECSTCQELGEVCGAGELCDEPFDVIYPYQEKSITRCRSCHLPYHKRCFVKCQKICSCVKNVPVRTDFSESLYEPGDSESDVSVDPSCSLPSEGGESVAIPLATVAENTVKPKISFLSSLLGSKEINSESQKDDNNSVVLGMSALSSHLDL